MAGLNRGPPPIHHMSEKDSAPAPAPVLSPETLQDGPWFAKVRQAYEVRTKPAHPPPWVVPVIGGVIAGLLWIFGWHRTAIAGASIVALMTVLGIAHPATVGKVQRALAVFGTRAGQAIGWMLLAPLFLTVGPLSRVFTRVLGSDPLGRRAAQAPSYWHFTATERIRERMSARMFCVERRTRGRNWLAALALLGVLGLIAGEVVLRVHYGLHNPLLYTGDADCGYRPQPNQVLSTGRGSVTINNHSMRSARDVKPKEPGVFRIFMIGDSTLFGGEYLTNDETYAVLVEKLLNEGFAREGRRIEVLPMGVNGWGPHHALGYVKRFGTFEADLGIIAMSAGNCDRPLTLIDGTRYPASRPLLAWQAVIARIAWEENRKIATRSSGDYVPDAAESRRITDAGENAYVELGALMKQSTPEVMQQAIPQMTYGMDAMKGTIEALPGDLPSARPYITRLEPRLAALGIAMDYPAELFVGRGTREELFHDDAHLDKPGHRIFAEYLAARVVRESKGFRTFAGLTNTEAGSAP